MVDHRNIKLTKFKKNLDVIFVEVTIRMATVQHLVMDNKKRRPIIYRMKPDLNKTFKEATKAVGVDQVQISLMDGDHIIMNILVQITLLLQVLLTTLMEVLQIRLHNNNKLSQIDYPKWKIL